MSIPEGAGKGMCRRGRGDFKAEAGAFNADRRSSRSASSSRSSAVRKRASQITGLAALLANTRYHAARLRNLCASSIATPIVPPMKMRGCNTIRRSWFYRPAGPYVAFMVAASIRRPFSVALGDQCANRQSIAEPSSARINAS